MSRTDLKTSLYLHENELAIHVEFGKKIGMNGKHYLKEVIQCLTKNIKRESQKRNIEFWFFIGKHMHYAKSLSINGW